MSSAQQAFSPADMRATVLAEIKPEEVQDLSAEQVGLLQVRLGLGEVFGFILFPEHELPPGYKSPARRGCDFNRYVRGLKEADRSLAVLTLMRLAILLYLIRSGTWRQRTIPSPSTYLMWLRIHARMVQMTHASGTSPLEQGKVFALVNPDQLPKVSAQIKKRIDIEIARLRQLSNEGLWRDAPLVAEPAKFERSRLDAATLVRDPTYTASPYEPLPDVFVADAGWRSLWVLKDLGPALIRCAEGLIPLATADIESESANTIFIYRQRLAKQFLKAFDWTDSLGAKINTLPFTVNQKNSEPYEWPPRSIGTVRQLLGLVQFAHLFIFLLSTGARIGEALSLEDTGLQDSGDSAVGRTFKLVFKAEGEIKEWPIPEVAALALRQQERLRDVLHALPAVSKGSAFSPSPVTAEPSGTFWSKTFGGALDNGYNEMLNRWATALDLRAQLGKRGLHSHRFRKTLARLAALALVGAPKILMDLFGHRTIEMTLHYILTDPQLRAEIQEVAKAQTIMLAEQAIEEAAASGGPAAPRVQKAVASARARRGEDFQASDVRELAELLTLNGTTWQLVRPGVVCIKSPSEAGPCSRRVGVPEPSKCRSYCSHRLEQALLKDDVARTLAEATANFESAVADGDEITAEEWKGQVLANLRRFPELEEKWKRNKTVRGILAQQRA